MRTFQKKFFQKRFCLNEKNIGKMKLKNGEGRKAGEMEILSLFYLMYTKVQLPSPYSSAIIAVVKHFTTNLNWTHYIYYFYYYNYNIKKLI